jgi:hypothetical protein
MSWAFSEEAEEVVELVAHATSDNMTAASAGVIHADLFIFMSASFLLVTIR